MTELAAFSETKRLPLPSTEMLSAPLGAGGIGDIENDVNVIAVGGRGGHSVDDARALVGDIDIVGSVDGQRRRRNERGSYSLPDENGGGSSQYPRQCE